MTTQCAMRTALYKASQWQPAVRKFCSLSDRPVRRHTSKLNNNMLQACSRITSRQQVEVNMPACRLVKALSTGRIARTCEMPVDLWSHAESGIARPCTRCNSNSSECERQLGCRVLAKGQADLGKLSSLASGVNAGQTRA